MVEHYKKIAKNFVAGFIIVFVIALYSFYSTYPHYFMYEVVQEHPEAIYRAPSLDCSVERPFDTSKEEKTYVRRWFTMCEVSDIPLSKPYIYFVNKPVYYLYKLSNILGVFMILGAVLLIIRQKFNK